MPLPLYAIIVAGGSGSRMKSVLPKQFIAVGGLPVLMHTVSRFYEFDQRITIILVLPEKDITTWHDLCATYHFTIPVQVVRGGVTRFDSVKNGLAAIEDTNGLVAIHDGVRPFVTLGTIQQSFKLAKEKGSAVAVIPLKDSIRRIDDSGSSSAADRNAFCLVQTPQTFQISLIKRSYQLAEASELFTDDAIVAEKAGYTIHLVEGSYQNIKITTPEDLIWAEAFVAMKN